MRQGWETSQIDDVAKIINGGTPKSNVAEFWDGDVLWITPKDMGKLTDVYVGDTSRKITEAGLAKSSAKIIPANSVILSTRAPIGHLAINTEPMATNQGCRGLVPSGRMLTKFLFYFLSANVRRLDDLGTGTTFKELAKSALAGVEIPLPPLPEQKRIVAILDEAFQGIDRAVANTEKNLANARELFESYLNALFTEVDEEWRELKLKDIAEDYGRGKSKHRPRNDPTLYDGPYPFIQTGDVRNADHIIRDYSQTYNDNGLAQSKIWPKGTVCVTIAANIAETGILDFDACFPDSVVGIVCDETKALNHFVEFMLQFVKVRIQAKGKGSAQDNINLGTFETEFFKIPTVKTQREVVQRLFEIRSVSTELITRFYVKLDLLAGLKQSILHKAFAGELTADRAEPVLAKAGA